MIFKSHHIWDDLPPTRLHAMTRKSGETIMMTIGVMLTIRLSTVSVLCAEQQVGGFYTCFQWTIHVSVNYFTRYMAMNQWLSWEKLIINMADIDLWAISINCNGLNDDIKRNAVFSKLQKSGEEIFLPQETHSTAATEHKWRNEWGSSAM